MIGNISNRLSLKVMACIALLSIGGCQQTQTIVKPNPTTVRQFNLIAVNDIYNIEGIDARHSGGMARLRTLREQLSFIDSVTGVKQQPLMLHAGDFLFPSSMSSQFSGQQMIDMMNVLDGDKEAFDDRFLVTFGNHEFDKGRMKDAKMLAQRIEESDFYWLGSNVTLAPQARLDSEDFNRSLLKNALISINGIKVGVFSLTTDIAIPEYAAIDNDYVTQSKQNIAQLRQQGAEVILAVTHLKMSEDVALLEQLGEQGPDLILGGHEHNRQWDCIGKRCVIKADADIRSATVAKVSVDSNGEVNISHRFSILDDTTIDTDPAVKAQTDGWLARYQREYCDENQLPDGCLTEVFGKTAVTLIAEELEIRRYETNLGAYVADQMVRAFDNIELAQGRKVQASLINSGSLRLNQNIPAGSELNQWNINGIFQYPVDLRVLEISGKTLKAMIAHSIEDWTGNGWWLQVSGVAFRHDPVNQLATEISLVDEKGKPRLVKDDEKIVVVVNNYMADGSISNQDGYTMLTLDDEVVYADQLLSLKSIVIDVIKAKWAKGEPIAPALPGRVCVTTKPELYCVLDNAD